MRTIKNVLLISGILLTGCWIPLRTQSLQFQDVSHGDSAKGTEYIFQLEEVEITDPNGREFTNIDLYILNTETKTRFQVPRLVFSGRRVFRRQRYYDSEADIWRESQELSCDRCIAVVNRGESTYLITKQHSGGSAAYLRHGIVKLEHDTASQEFHHLSCGKPRIEGNQIVFSFLENDCPDILLGPRWGPEWQITRFTLD